MEQATNAIRQMLSKLIALWPRESGQGWNLAKFHEQLHVLDDIYYNGSPQGSHSGPVEHNHIQMVKQPSQRTQKRRTNLDNQLGKRLYESSLLNSAMEQMKSRQQQVLLNPATDPVLNGISKKRVKDYTQDYNQERCKVCFLQIRAIACARDCVEIHIRNLL